MTSLHAACMPKKAPAHVPIRLTQHGRAEDATPSGAGRLAGLIGRRRRERCSAARSRKAASVASRLASAMSECWRGQSDKRSHSGLH